MSLSKSYLNYRDVYLFRVFTRHWRSENPPFNMQNSPANVWRPMTSFYSDVEPLLKHSPVALHLSPTTRILKENTALGDPCLTLAPERKDAYLENVPMPNKLCMKLMYR